ncbi:Proton-dependent Oligopeptide Transporter (POT) Family [Pseudoloma neurophilia]|uniref:Proton-dependent Oligopeptide Transporter (POT) Family n=1 Tax=Pseudoloma neurophilia TaxID=146866 RepID=A0A0R0LZA8_9MICR|nr:Proton-dependent Oligopeptide Transporter (POT) Family [Pseudoloma neurophilia]
MKKIALFLIIGTEFCERFCYYGLRALIFPFMRDQLKMSYTISKFTAHAFFFCSFLFAVIFGFLSDIFIGHYITIISLSFAYFIGTVLLVLAAYWENSMLFIISIFVIAMGTGGIKPCISIFGGDQFRNKNFFSIFYFSINCGAMFSMLLLPILSEKSYTYAFSFPFILVSLAIIMFVSGTRLYTIKKPDPTLKYEILRFFRPTRKIRSSQDAISKRSTSFHIGSDIQARNNFSRTLDDSTIYNGPFSFSNGQIEQIYNENLTFSNEADCDFNESVGTGELQAFDIPRYERENEYRKSFSDECHPDLEDIEHAIRIAQHKKYYPEAHKSTKKYELIDDASNTIDQLSLMNEQSTTHDSDSEEMEIILENSVQNKIDAHAMTNENNQVQKITADSNHITHENEFPVVIVEDVKPSTTFRDDLKAICNVLKLFLPIIFFWTIYDQQATSWTDQASKLDQNIFNFRIIPSQMLVFNAFFTLICIPLCSKLRLSVQRKMVYGFYLGASSFFASALVEHFRTEKTSILVQIPQYILLTFGEVLLSVTGLEFSYTMAPYRFRSLVLAIWLFMASIGNVLVAIISKFELFKAPIGEYVFYGILAFLSSRILDYQFSRMKFSSKI